MVAPLSTIGAIVTPEQTVCVDGVATATGEGFTTTVALIGAPVQPFAVGIMVKVTVKAPPVVLVNAPVILPVPLAPMPVTKTVLSLVQL